MRPSNGLSPYPILAAFRDDYQETTLSTSIDVHMTTESLSLIVSIQLEDPELLALVEDGLAAYAVHVECGPTSYRRVFTSSDSKMSISIPSNVLADNLDVCTFVVATNDIYYFRSEHFHPDYGSEGFTAFKGNILAIGDSINITMQEEGDVPPSIIRVARGSERQSVNIQVNTDADEYIVVSLEPRLYDLYTQMGQSVYSDTVFSLILLPVLENVLTLMSQEQSDEDKQWFQTIERLLKKNGISLDDLADGSAQNSPLAVAQKIFEGPVLRSLENLATQTEAQVNED